MIPNRTSFNQPDRRSSSFGLLQPRGTSPPGVERTLQGQAIILIRQAGKFGLTLCPQSLFSYVQRTSPTPTTLGTSSRSVVNRSHRLGLKAPYPRDRALLSFPPKSWFPAERLLAEALLNLFRTASAP